MAYEIDDARHSSPRAQLTWLPRETSSQSTGSIAACSVSTGAFACGRIPRQRIASPTRRPLNFADDAYAVGHAVVAIPNEVLQYVADDDARFSHRRHFERVYVQRYDCGEIVDVLGAHAPRFDHLDLFANGQADEHAILGVVRVLALCIFEDARRVNGFAALALDITR